VSYRPDAHLSKASSIRTTRTFRPDLPLCREVSNCSSLHSSRRFTDMSERHWVFDKLRDFFPKHRYRKIAATVQTMWIPVWTLSSIRQVSQFKPRCPYDGPHGPNARALEMKITCIKSTVRTTILRVQTREALYGNSLQRKCNCPDDRAPPSRRGSKIGKNFNEILKKSIAQLFVWTAPSFYQAKRSFEPWAYK
jgi:hypothetical protein